MSDGSRIDTRVIHAGQHHEPITGAVMPPVFQTSTYAQPWPAVHTGYEYSRTQNPTREALERCVADLEGGAGGIHFASGLAATATVLHTLETGDRVVCGDDVYGGTYRQFERVFRQLGLEFSYVDFATADLEQAIPEGTRMVWLETPTNPLLKVADIAAVSARAKAVGARVVVDNTFATPIFQQPLSLGADIVVHSTTKYLNGHRRRRGRHRGRQGPRRGGGAQVPAERHRRGLGPMGLLAHPARPEDPVRAHGAPPGQRQAHRRVAVPAPRGEAHPLPPAGERPRVRRSQQADVGLRAA